MPATERSVSEAAPATAPERRQGFRRPLLVALVLVAGFAVVYLITANLILRTRFMRDVVSEGPDVELDYESAYSVWPGRVHVRGFSLAVQTYSDQLSVTASSGVVTISLHELLLRRFHATRLTAQGVAFRFRQKVAPAESATARVAAYPAIRGFPDPPVYVGKEPAPVGDADYDLWQIALDDVHAALEEVWFLEYRYVGLGRVSGGFRLQPARSFALYPARLELDPGPLSVGDGVGAARLDLELEGYITHTDVQENALAALADHVTGRVRLTAQAVDLAALDSRADERPSWQLRGRAELGLAASARDGRLEADSSAELVASELTLASPLGEWAGALSSTLRVVGHDERIDWVTTSSLLSLASASRPASASFGSPRIAVELRGDRLAKGPRLHGVELDLPELVVPALGAYDGWARRLGVADDIAGRVEGRAHVVLAADRGPALSLRIALSDAALVEDDLRVALDGRIEAELMSVAGVGRRSSGRVDIELDRVEIARGGEDAKPFRGAVRLPDPTLSLEPRFQLSTGVDAYATPADPLLSLALGSPMLEDLAADLFNLERLEGRARLNVEGAAVSVELTQATSGALRGSGFWRRPSEGRGRGAFLIASQVANVGLSLVGAETKTSWLVPDDWLASGGHPLSAGEVPEAKRPRKEARRPSEARARR